MLKGSGGCILSHGSSVGIPTSIIAVAMEIVTVEPAAAINWFELVSQPWRHLFPTQKPCKSMRMTLHVLVLWFS